MTPRFTLNLLRILFVTFCATIGSMVSNEILDYPLPGAVLGLFFGLLVVLVDRLLKGFSLRAFSSATLGLMLGLFFAKLLIASDVLHYLPETTKWAIRLITYSTFGYFGMMLAMRSNRDEFSLIIPYVRFARETTQHEPLILDTNVIIDGRIADLCATGFLSQLLIVPRFVLAELQTLADSHDPQKRERGRRGLEILNQLQHAPELDLTIHDSADDAGVAGRRPARAHRETASGASAHQRSGALPGRPAPASAGAEPGRSCPGLAAYGRGWRRTGTSPDERRTRGRIRPSVISPTAR